MLINTSKQILHSAKPFAIRGPPNEPWKETCYFNKLGINLPRTTEQMLKGECGRPVAPVKLLQVRATKILTIFTLIFSKWKDIQEKNGISLALGLNVKILHFVLNSQEMVWGGLVKG